MRGQISLDLILAITIGFFAIGAVIALSAQIDEMQTEASIRQQLNDIGNGLAAVISNSAVLNDATTASIDFDVPSLLVPGEEKPQPCTIEINKTDGTIILSYDVFDLETGTSTPVEVTKYYVNPPGMTVLGNVKCGGMLSITKP